MENAILNSSSAHRVLYCDKLITTRCKTFHLIMCKPFGIIALCRSVGVISLLMPQIIQVEYIKYTQNLIKRFVTVTVGEGRGKEREKERNRVQQPRVVALHATPPTPIYGHVIVSLLNSVIFWRSFCVYSALWLLKRSHC